MKKPNKVRITSLAGCISESLKKDGLRDLNAKFSAVVFNEVWQVLSVAVDRKSFSLFCEQGIVTYKVKKRDGEYFCKKVYWEISND